MSVLGGEIRSSKVGDGGCTSSSFFTRPQKDTRSWVREPQQLDSALPSMVTPPFSSSFLHSFQETPQDIKPLPSSKFRSKEKVGRVWGNGLT